MLPAIILAAGTAAATYYGNKYAADKEAQSRSQALGKLSAMSTLADRSYDTMDKTIADYYKNRGSMGTAQDVRDYADAMRGYNAGDYVYDIDSKPFDYNKTIESFLNPYRDQIIGDMTQQVQHTAAGAGLGRGSGAAQSIAQAVADKDEELYNQAYDRYTDDRNFMYNKYADYIKNKQAQLDTLRAATESKIAMQGNLANDYYSVMDAAQADKIAAMQDRQSTKAAYASAMAGL